MAGVTEIPPAATVFTDDLATLKTHADTLGVPLQWVVRHAINQGMSGLATAIGALGAEEGINELDDGQL